MINLGYTIYLILTVFLVAYVGQKLHRDGGVWLDFLFLEEEMGSRLNNLLLVGYYLTNLGMAFFSMTNWDYTIPPLCEAFCKTGTNALILSYLHFQNIIIINFFHNYKLIKK
jgi:hypothetical protein